MTDLSRRDPDATGVLHSLRFRRVSNRYPRRVAEAVGIEEASRLSDEEVARRVAEWERAHGLEARDWYRIGREDEGRGEDG